MDNARYLLSYTREICGITDHLTAAAALKKDPVAFEAVLKEMQAAWDKKQAEIIKREQKRNVTQLGFFYPKGTQNGAKQQQR